jgi:hypothetical protein
VKTKVGFDLGFNAFLSSFLLHFSCCVRLQEKRFLGVHHLHTMMTYEMGAPLDVFAILT